MTVQITFDREYQPWLAASKEDSRPVLQGIYVDPSGMLVAADGYVLVAVPCDIYGDLPLLDGQGPIVPAMFLESTLRHIPRGERYSFCIEDNLQVVVKARTAEFRSSVTRDKFPLWRHLVPEPDEVQTKPFQCYDAEKLYRVARALSSDNTFVTVATTGGGHGPYFIAASHSEGFGLVMPTFATDPEGMLETRVRQYAPLR